MAAKKPRVVIIGAGMAGITAANRLHVAAPGEFDLTVVEGGNRIGGRIWTSEFNGDRIEMGATWIHGIGGSPVHAIATEIGALQSDQPWECMDGSQDDPNRLVTVFEGGSVPDQTLTEPISDLFKSLMNFAQNKSTDDDSDKEIAVKAYESLAKEHEGESISVGEFLRRGLSLYMSNSPKCVNSSDSDSDSLYESLFEVFENTQRTYTAAGDLSKLDFTAESEYRMCSDEEITIGRGYSSVVHHLASSLPPGIIRLGKKVETIEWGSNSAVKLRFADGTSDEADHVIVTVSLGVLKASGVRFNPGLPSFKLEAIERLGFGVVNKLFVRLSGSEEEEFPFLRMAFHKKNKNIKNSIPIWMRKTASMFPIYDGSGVLLSWFAGEEALEIERLGEDEIAEGVSETISAFVSNGVGARVQEVVRTRWGSDPLFQGSYSYVAVGSSGEDLDAMAEPLPRVQASSPEKKRELQILFAGEATHRTHYSTTHGAYFSGIREANRLLQHYSNNNTCLANGNGNGNGIRIENGFGV